MESGRLTPNPSGLRSLPFLSLIAALLLLPAPAQAADCLDYEGRPHWVGKWGPLGAMASIAVRGNYSFVASANYGLLILDTRDPSRIEFAGGGNYWNDGPVGVALSDNLVCVACLNQRLGVYDADHFRELGSVSTPGAAYGVAVRGRLAYVACDTSGLVIVDLSVPSAPRVTGTAAAPGRCRTVAIQGSIAYVTAETAGLLVFDVSDRQAPKLLAEVPTGHRAKGVVVDGSYAYVSDKTAGLLVFDVSDPAAPLLVGRTEAGGEASAAITMVGSSTICLGVLQKYSGIVLFDVSDPRAPRRRGTLAAFDTAPSAMTTVGQRVYATFINRPLAIFDVTPEELPGPLGSFALADSASTMLTGRHYVYMAEASGIEIFDLSDPLAPVLASRVPFAAARDCALRGNYLYVAAGPQGLRILDVSDPRAPVEAGSVETPGDALAVALADSLAVLALGSAGVRTIDISDPHQPRPVGPGIRNPAIDVAAGGSTVWVLGRSALYAYDLSNVESPQSLGTSPTRHSIAVSASARGPYAYSLDPSILTVMGVARRYLDAGATIGTPSGGLRSFVETRNYVYLADSLGFQVVDVRDLGRPRTVGSVVHPGITALTAYQDKLYAAVSNSSGHRVQIFPAQCGGEGGGTITDLRASVGDRGVNLRWRMPSGVPYLGFLVWRYKDFQPNSGQCLNCDRPIPAGPILSYVDQEVAPLATYTYMISGVWPDGSTDEFGPVYATIPDRADPSLSVSPNPARGSAHLQFSLPASGPIELGIYDVNGRRIRLLRSGFYLAGTHTTWWGGADDRGGLASSGVYFLRLRANGRTEVRRLLLLRQ